MKKNDLKKALENVSIDYSGGVLVLPLAAAERLCDADKKDVESLLYCLYVLQGGEPKCAASMFNISSEVDIKHWQECGVIRSDVNAITPSAEPKKPTKHKKPEVGVPHYSTEELGGVLERRSDAAAVIDECEKTIGKMFSTSEVAKVVGLMDYLDLDGEYITNLCVHCVRIGKKSLRYIETTAFELYDKGITTTDALNEHLRAIEATAKLESRIRSLFGMNPDRALTARERAFIDAWVGKFGYDLDVIKKAYEITVDAIGKPSLPYANAILESWDAAMLKSIDEVNGYLAAKDGSDNSKPVGSSFNTESFFEASLRRSYGDSDAIPETVSKQRNNKNNNT